MALDRCFQISTVSAARAGVPQFCHPFSPAEKFHLSTCNGFKKSSVSFRSKCPSSRFVCKARETVNEVLVVTDASWDNMVIGSENAVLVEFWAPWCGPCRMIAPVIDELAKEYAGKVSCYKVNTDDCPNIATRYGIRSIPTVLFFKNGEKKESVIGAVPKSTLSTTLEKYIEV